MQTPLNEHVKGHAELALVELRRLLVVKLVAALRMTTAMATAEENLVVSAPGVERRLSEEKAVVTAVWIGNGRTTGETELALAIFELEVLVLERAVTSAPSASDTMT